MDRILNRKNNLENFPSLKITIVLFVGIFMLFFISYICINVSKSNITNQNTNKNSEQIIILSSHPSVDQDHNYFSADNAENPPYYQNCPGTVFLFRLYNSSKPEKDKIKTIAEHFFPFEKNRHLQGKWQNLKRRGNNWFFINNTNKDWMLFEFFYDVVKEKIYIGNTGKLRTFFSDDVHLIGITPDCRQILDSFGNLTDIEYVEVSEDSGNTNAGMNNSSLINASDINNKAEIRSIVLTDDNYIIIQKETASESSVGLYENHIIIKKLNNNQVKSVSYGFDPCQNHDRFRFCPTDINQERTKVIFLADLNQKNKRELWVCVWDTRFNKVSQVSLIDGYLPMTPDSLLWRPVKNSHEAALCQIDGVIIIDSDSGKIIERITPSFGTIRWSPDGSKLGMMDYQGRLYYYDMNTKKLIRVDENPDNFNFFWVE